MAARDVAVVVDLDAGRRRLEAQYPGDAGEQPALGRAFGEPAGERVAGVGDGLDDQVSLGATLRMDQPHAAPGADAERRLDKLVSLHGVTEHHDFRRRAGSVELAEKSGDHLARLGTVRVGREVGAVAEVLPRAEEEDLNAACAGVLMAGDDIGGVDAGHVDALARLDLGQRADAIAKDRRGLVIAPGRGRLHAPRKARLNIVASPREEGARLVDDGVVLGLADTADTGRRTAFDLILEARSGAAREDAVGARAQRESTL